ncbi:MAG: hypothetical protein NZ551_08405 [Microscillaceae bacterium]|nr:hypothetical protein [Microscillaceae bacterium]MDW8461220.1 hypothetical protein [Cytophagales bacterium]
MKNKLFLFAVSSLFYVTLSFAQRQGGRNWDPRDFKPEEVAERQTKILKDSLGLDAEQEKKVQAINLKYAQKTQKLLLDSLADQMERFQEMRIQNENRAYEIRKVLKKEQVKKFNQMQERMRNRQNRRQGIGNNNEGN